MISAFFFSGWLFGFEGRVDSYRRIDESASASALSLAPLAGRRVRLDTLSLDFFGGLALVYQGTATFMKEGPPDERVTESSSSTVPRLVVSSRLSFRARSTVRFFVGLSGEVGPPRATEAERPLDAPRLPLWTAGLNLGATVGTL
ncbi:MAG TPA: hypothetical protein VM580_24715 [Labilithrix sp.]|nr:hypothetical protein [Labilithrix sp.]